MKTFPGYKTITELRIDTKRKFIVVVALGNFEVGDILTLVTDDDTPSPLFKNQGWKTSYMNLSNLEYYEGKVPRWVYVDHYSVESALRDKETRLLIFEWMESIRNKYVCQSKAWYVFQTWNFIAEIPPEEERIKMTLEEIEEALGKKIEIIL